MKLNHISIQNVACVASAEVPTLAPIVIVAGLLPRWMWRPLRP